MKTNLELVPLLIVRGAARAIDFYMRALGAEVLARYEHGAERRISHADLKVADAAFAVTEEARAWNSDAPPSLGGSPVVMQLGVADTDAVLVSMRDAGATVIFPAVELLGERMARVRDPFGHIWILRQRVEKLSIEEIQRRRDELFAGNAGVPRTRVENKNTLNDPSPRRQGRDDGMLARRPARIHLVVGPVGAGKSTFAAALARDREAVRFTLDQWMADLFRPDRPSDGMIAWYVERAARCVEQIWTVTKCAVDVGVDVVLEIGLLQRCDREKFYARADDAGVDLKIHVLDASRDARRERVRARNEEKGATFSMVVPPDVFEMASDLWEPLDPIECDGRDVRVIRTD